MNRKQILSLDEALEVSERRKMSDYMNGLSFGQRMKFRYFLKEGEQYKGRVYAMLCKAGHIRGVY